MLSNRICLGLTFVLPLVLVAGCPQGDGMQDQDAGGAAGAGGRGGAGGGDSSLTGPKGAMAASCAANADCASGFCADGVCCDSPCDGQCLSCALPGAPGHCGPIAQGPDPTGAATCTGDSSCFLNSVTSLSVCKLVDGAACSADADCGVGHCLTFFVDGDGDGYGTAQAARFCADLNAPPPAGYAAFTGDCCDLDSGANPGFSAGTFLQFADACGSYDWNCNGSITLQYSSCPGAGVPACGTDCIFNIGLASGKLYTQACN
jgi:hypothetical protein